MSDPQASVIGTAKESEHFLGGIKKRIQQCCGTARGQRESLGALRHRLLGEHIDDSPPDEAPEPVRSDIEELNHQLNALQEQQELVGQHIESLMHL